MIIGDNLIGIKSAKFNNKELNNYIIKISIFPFFIIYNIDYELKNITLRIGVFEYSIGITIDY